MRPVPRKRLPEAASTAQSQFHDAENRPAPRCRSSFYRHRQSNAPSEHRYVVAPARPSSAHSLGPSNSGKVRRASFCVLAASTRAPSSIPPNLFWRAAVIRTARCGSTQLHPHVWYACLSPPAARSASPSPQCARWRAAHAPAARSQRGHISKNAFSKRAVYSPMAVSPPARCG